VIVPVDVLGENKSEHTESKLPVVDGMHAYDSIEVSDLCNFVLFDVKKFVED
jgi:hypothetical protein